MNLDLVFGMSCNNVSSITCDHNSGLVAHAASGVLVILDTKTNCQVKYLHLRKNSVSTAQFSADGTHIVTGEIGFRPAVRIWRVKDGAEVASLYGHEFGIKCVLFSPSMDEIVSVGLEHDNVVNVWSWPDKHKLATNKIVDVIKAMAYSECGSFFVTAGIRHLKFWYPKITVSEGIQTIVPTVKPLYGRPGILEYYKQHTFIDVVCGNGASTGYVFTMTKAGGLVILSGVDRRLNCQKSIEGLRGTCVKAHDQILFMGFSSGDVHMFNSVSLVHLAALPVPTFFRRTGVNGGGVLSLTFNPFNTLLTTAYKNSSMCVWDLHDVKNVKQQYVAVYHNKAIASFDIFTSDDPGDKLRETLVTVSHDATLRLWGVVIDKSICYDRLSIMYTDTPPTVTEEAQAKLVENSGNIVTAVRVSPDKKYIVTGNKAGNICVYDRETYEHLMTVMAHNREITCFIFYSNGSGRSVLISGSRDRLIHIMDANNEFRLVSTLNIHSSSITALRVCEVVDRVCMISCAADRGISICTSPIASVSGGTPYFQLSRYATSVSSPADIAVDMLTHQVAVGCQDGNVRVLDIALLQEQRMFRGCQSLDGQIQKLQLDRKGALLLTAVSDRTINVINYRTGDVLHSVTGHTKNVTGLVFSSNDDYIISTSYDGCMFVWRLTDRLLLKRKEICYYLEAKALKEGAAEEQIISSPTFGRQMVVEKKQDDSTVESYTTNFSAKDISPRKSQEHTYPLSPLAKRRSPSQLSPATKRQSNFSDLVKRLETLKMNNSSSAIVPESSAVSVVSDSSTSQGQNPAGHVTATETSDVPVRTELQYAAGQKSVPHKPPTRRGSSLQRSPVADLYKTKAGAQGLSELTSRQRSTSPKMQMSPDGLFKDEASPGYKVREKRIGEGFMDKVFKVESGQTLRDGMGEEVDKINLGEQKPGAETRGRSGYRDIIEELKAKHSNINGNKSKERVKMTTHISLTDTPAVPSKRYSLTARYLKEIEREMSASDTDVTDSVSACGSDAHISWAEHSDTSYDKISARRDLADTTKGTLQRESASNHSLESSNNCLNTPEMAEGNGGAVNTPTMRSYPKHFSATVNPHNGLSLDMPDEYDDIVEKREAPPFLRTPPGIVLGGGDQTCGDFWGQSDEMYPEDTLFEDGSRDTSPRASSSFPLSAQENIKRKHRLELQSRFQYA